MVVDFLGKEIKVGDTVSCVTFKERRADTPKS